MRSASWHEALCIRQTNCCTPSPVRTERCAAEDMPMLRQSLNLGDSTIPRWSVGLMYKFLLVILAYEQGDPDDLADCDLP